MKITIYGSGYVGLSNGLALSRKNEVNIIDINQNRVDQLINKTLQLEEELSSKELQITTAIFSTVEMFSNTDLYILALPTDYDEVNKKFNTEAIDKTIKKIRSKNKNTPIIIKSTIPVGYTNSFNDKNIVFSPEFLREGTSFEDTINPSRIIVGSEKEGHSFIGKLFLEVSVNNPEVVYMSSKEAEAVKLFSNTYLAMRVAYVNELSNFAAANGMKTNNIIKGVGLDPRIGSHYFNPSTGYGGYCLPKDSKQLLAEFNNNKVENKLFDAIVESNDLRVKKLIDRAIKLGIQKIAINGIGHKPGVTNQRASTKLTFAQLAREKGIEVIFIDEKDGGGEFKILKNKPNDFTWVEDLY